MIYVPFQEYFPELGAAETRCLQILDDPQLAGDKFAFIELFCDEPGCDCRRVMLNIFSDGRKRSVGTINFGWETEKFYENWYGGYDKEIIGDMKGPCINRLGVYTNITEKMFGHVKKILTQKEYVDRLKRHYDIFKEFVEKREAMKKIGR